ncbi:MAG: hypothetical protein HYY85_06880 [Deltaproteobacteria bacterium]|nr:hypothetical protein [Deltaproteobacteria bacterium]
MRVRRFRVRIKPVEEALGEFKEAYLAATQGRPYSYRGGVYFTSLEAVRNVLTARRMLLLHTVREKCPRSIYALARLLGRNIKNVHADVQLLEELGLLTLVEGPKGRGAKQPKATCDSIEVTIAI